MCVLSVKHTCKYICMYHMNLNHMLILVLYDLPLQGTPPAVPPPCLNTEESSELNVVSVPAFQCVCVINHGFEVYCTRSKAK